MFIMLVLLVYKEVRWVAISRKNEIGHDCEQIWLIFGLLQSNFCQ
jgi:hypothetical protein